jgi:hypothetical protein
MKTYHDFISENFDSFKVFVPKANANEEDSEYGIRALIRYTHVLPSGEKTVITALFPPIQLRTTDNKYEFNRHLNAMVASLKAEGKEIVGIHMKGDPLYNKIVGIRK